ncbi:MAG: hypothetical protein KDA45_01170 [Planctomycetales bacterium]|nr:hypothetical protein [Planctomycetales bacterium]
MDHQFDVSLRSRLASGKNGIRRLGMIGVMGALLLLPSRPVNADYVNFGVGNSLTWDMLLAGAFDSTTTGQSSVSSTGYHIRCNSSLTATLANPSEVCVEPSAAGLYSQALGNRLDNLFLQPFYGATARQEIDSVKQFVDLARSNTANGEMSVYIYATWGQNTVADPFLDTWKNHVAALDDPFVPSVSSYDLVVSTLKAEGYDVGLIPAGHTFAAITEAMNNGLTIEGLATPNDLYRDTIHASNAGKYAAALAAFSAVYGVDPTGQTMNTYPFDLPGYGPVLAGEGITKVQQLAWQTHLTVAAIPEPSAILPLVFALSAVGCFGRRRTVHPPRAQA